MIYGQYAKQYARNNNTYKVVSESDSIINYLIKEQDNYSNLLLNESYIDEEERIVMEAKYEVLQEAVVGAMVTAIIAVIGAIIGLVIYISKVSTKGIEKATENIKKTTKEIEEKKKKLQSEVEGLKGNYEKQSDELDLAVSQKYIKGMFECMKYEAVDKLSNEEFNEILNNIVGESDIKTISLFNFSSIIDTTGINHINDILKSYLSIGSEKYKEEIEEYFDDTRGRDKLNHLLFEKWYADKDQKDDRKPMEILTDIYNSRSEDMRKVFREQKTYLDQINKIKSAADSDIKDIENVLTQTKKLFEQFQKRVKDKANKVINKTKNDNSDKAKATKEHFQQELAKLSNMSFGRVKEITTAWSQIEIKRLSLMVKITNSKLVREKCELKLWEEYKQKYGEKFVKKNPEPHIMYL